MDTITAFVTDNFEFIAVIVGLAWAVFKGTSLYTDIKDSRMWNVGANTATAISAAVSKTYNDKVRDMKRSLKDGEKLSKKDIDEIRQYAIDVFRQEVIDMAKNKLKVNKLTPNAIISMIEKEVTSYK